MKSNSLAIPAAIVIAAALIAGAIFLSGRQSQEPQPVGGLNTDTGPTAQEPSIRPVDETDHIRGNPNAQILLVEYSDFDCPFCQQYHATMKRIIDEYGIDGRVAWVYRQFPLQQLHPNAPHLAEASECVADLGGNDSFWKFADLVFGEKPTNDFTDISRLPEFAETSGVDGAAFSNCLESGKFKDKVNESIQEAVAAGGQGTPHTIVMVGDQSGVINGAQPYEVVKQIIEQLLGEMDGKDLGGA